MSGGELVLPASAAGAAPAPAAPAPPTEAARITEDLCAPAFRFPGPAWWAAFLAAAGLAGLLVLAVAVYVIAGYGVFGVNNVVNWGNDIATYIYWIAVAVAGTIVSSVLLLFRQGWRTGINRATEAMTIFAINIAGLFPLIHTGRPWVDYWLIPLPNDLALWPQFKSPIMWDVFAITGYAVCSILFFYLGLIPDFATLRDRAPRAWQRRLYGFLAMGWSGSSADWNHYERAYRQFAWLATPLVIAMHSTIATLLAVSHVPGWHATIFPPYFVAGAVFGGLAMAFVVLVPLRAAYRLHRYITDDHLERLAKIFLAVGLAVAYVYGMEFFAAWWSEAPAEREQFWWRLTGEGAWSFWLMLACNLLPIQLLWWRRWRRHGAALVVIGIFVNIGMWFERYNILVLSLRHGQMPSEWTTYAFTAFDWLLLAGSFGLFFAQILLFARIAPMVSVAEVKAELLGRSHG
ncbi:MAG: NrfD/PsrC family molybdoenzyme membrane anchor subunit [Planctomycetota bacterium]|nr:polysulfide reductase NrfD [Planctomycetota bacterium]MCX8039878.1 polysulfide reductase NrfD [Planctomycetota bacterium]MDW8372163.1 NrfD/PsrC family molybdoenzyme membrane anchor subunit [Planctomycetota bacterium]